MKNSSILCLWLFRFMLNWINSGIFSDFDWLSEFWTIQGKVRDSEITIKAWIPRSHCREEVDWYHYRRRRLRGRAISRCEICDLVIPIPAPRMTEKKVSMYRFLCVAGEFFRLPNSAWIVKLVSFGFGFGFGFIILVIWIGNFRPLSDDELRLHTPVVISCNEGRREVSAIQNIANKQIDRTFAFDKVCYAEFC